MNENQDNRLIDVRRTLARLGDEIRFGMRLNALWQRCAAEPDILDRMRGTIEGAAFDSLRDGLHMSLVQSVMRLHDNAKGTVSFGRVFKALAKPEMAQAVARLEWAARIDSIAKVTASRASLTGPDIQGWLDALKVLRDEHIAHSGAERGVHGAKYGYEKRILSASIGAFENLDLAINATSNDFELEEREYAAQADAFWSHVALPAR
jgi:hypothetical protein